MRLMLAATALALTLGACEDPDVVAAQDQAARDQAALAGPPAVEGDARVQVAQAPQITTPAGPPQVEAEIDWDAARTARASSNVNASPITTQNASGGAAPEVPVLLPSGVVQAQNARAPAMIVTDDGYFATYQMPNYDAIVNGTKSAYGPERAPRGDAMQFTISEASAQLSFARFGADYLIEFECRQVDGGESCITEDEARAFADSLFVAQTR